MSVQTAVDPETHVRSEPQRVGVKIFFGNPEAFDRGRMIEVFHRWIRENRLPGTLIDVHDYTHVPEGPGVVLIAHEWHLRTDEKEGRVGFEFEFKRGATGTFAERLLNAIAWVLEAGSALEEEMQGAAAVRFNTGEMVFRFTDRLAVPATSEAYDQVTERLVKLLGAVYGEVPWTFERVGHARGPLTIHARVDADGEWSLQELASGARSAAG